MIVYNEIMTIILFTSAENLLSLQLIFNSEIIIANDFINTSCSPTT